MMNSHAATQQAVELIVTCGSWQEAQKIVDRLLEMRLIACAELIPITSKFSWHDVVQESNEIKLIMISFEHCFDAVEVEISKLHSYETFVLQAIPVTRISKDAVQWLNNEISGITEASHSS